MNNGRKLPPFSNLLEAPFMSYQEFYFFMASLFSSCPLILGIILQFFLYTIWQYSLSKRLISYQFLRLRNYVTFSQHFANCGFNVLLSEILWLRGLIFLTICLDDCHYSVLFSLSFVSCMQRNYFSIRNFFHNSCIYEYVYQGLSPDCTFVEISFHYF